MGSQGIDAILDDEMIEPGPPDSRPAWDPSVGSTPLGFGRDAEPLVLDWHGAGEPDLLVTAGPECGRRARLFRPRNGATAGMHVYDAGQPVEALDGLRCVCVLRNGKPSRFDLVGLDAGGLVWLPNQGDAGEPAFGPRCPLGIGPDLGIGSVRVVQMFGVDWDGDGLDDLLIGVDDLTDYWPDGDRVPHDQQKGFNQRGGHPGYNREGLWRGRPPVGRILWLRNTGRPEAPAFELGPEIQGETDPLDIGMHPGSLAVAWERPRALQLLLTDRRGLIHLYRNFGDQRPPVLMEPKSLTCGGAVFLLPDDRTALVAADLDGDRRDELIYGTADGQVFAVHAGSGRHEVKTPLVVTQESGPLWLGGGAVVTAADLGGDGSLDLVVGVASGRLWSYDDTGTDGRRLYKAPQIVEGGGVPFRADPGPDGMLDGPMQSRLGHACPALVDWIGHDRIDLLVGGASGEVTVLRNDGSRTEPRFGSPEILRCQGFPLITPPRVRPAAADWSGQGELDLLTLNLQGFLCVYPRAGKLLLGPPTPLIDRLGRCLRLDGGFGLSGGCAFWAGPWCGSEQIDLLVGLSLANRHVVPALTGHAFHELSAIPTVLLLENLGHGVLCPRPFYHADGRPLVLGCDGCSPMGVPGAAGQGLDLLVGQDDGSLSIFRRGDLRW